MPDTITVSCPTCHKVTLWEEKNIYRPFCSKRCQLIDLGEWASEEKRISSAADVADNESWSEQPQE